MDKEAMINYWVQTANRDYKTMMNLFKSKDYHWSLFIGHLVIEKLLKAIYVKNVDNNPPRIHDLLRLAEKAQKPKAITATAAILRPNFPFVMIHTPFQFFVQIGFT
jgi:HEPN domain-containing protein